MGVRLAFRATEMHSTGRSASVNSATVSLRLNHRHQALDEFASTPSPRCEPKLAASFLDTTRARQQSFTDLAEIFVAGNGFVKRQSALVLSHVMCITIAKKAIYFVGYQVSCNELSDQQE